MRRRSCRYRSIWSLALTILPLAAAVEGCQDGRPPAGRGGHPAMDAALPGPPSDAAVDAAAAPDGSPMDAQRFAGDAALPDGSAPADGGDLAGGEGDVGAGLDVLLVPDGCVPAGEVCDGEDNDCDGEVDEQLAAGPCSSVCGQGKLRCRDGRTVCDAPQPTPEVCDGQDNDCNAAVDDGLAHCCWPIGATRPCGIAEGRCTEGVQTCRGADGWGACAGGQGPQEERCNGEDDDCNGVVDDMAREGEPCGSALGECRQGNYHCANGVELCLDEVGPVNEVCDGLDNDCDGTNDQGNPGGGEPCGPAVGLCRPGVLTCTEGMLRCLGGVRPQPELCNSEDDDCNGETDEGEPGDVGLACDTGLAGRCAAGVTRCAEGNRRCAQLHEALLTELCNGEDDDCNGETDEGLGKGEPCSAGLGSCRRAGEKICAVDGRGTICSALPALPDVELCGNGRDDDCDGLVDEGFPVGQACSAGIGACRRDGQLTCSADRRWVSCNADPGPPGAEQCGTGVDEDCDGEVDEGFPVGQRCEVGLGLCRRVGMLVCAADRLGVACSVEPGAAGQELCGSGLDEDCDGEVDEGFPVGQRCEVGRGACRAVGMLACADNRLEVACTAVAGRPGEELCGTGVDEDCDGEVDEGFAIGERCFVGQGVCRREGKQICAPDGRGVVCDATPGEPEVELCGTELDEDCDGLVDEGFASLGQPCTVGRGICARQGSYECTGNRLGLLCDAMAGEPQVELCGTELDEDCDGAVDEGFDVGQPCSVGQGVCRRDGHKICSPLDRRLTICDQLPGQPTEEICDRLDNDCDGATDEELADCGDECGPGIIDDRCDEPDRLCVRWPNAGNGYHCSLPCDNQGECLAGFACSETFDGFEDLIAMPVRYALGFGVCLPNGPPAIQQVGQPCQSGADCVTGYCFGNVCRQLCSSEGWRNPQHDFCPAGEACVSRNVGGTSVNLCLPGVAAGQYPSCQTHYDCSPPGDGSYVCAILNQPPANMVLGCAENPYYTLGLCELGMCPTWDNIGGFCNSDTDCFRGWCFGFRDWLAPRCTDMCVSDEDCSPPGRPNPGNKCKLGTVRYQYQAGVYFPVTAVRMCSNEEW